ncbi:MAG: HAMP domain-containing sensor histidine kinase [Bacteroidia bacterium]|nr:HAMP domain-containing histidine kinase [Bacteroidia bacterium]MDW8158911.1 HAMP domain-containing sensor histidine kinase [Bacteroidia bacterium]
MKIRNKILLSFSVTVISLTVLSSLVVYLLFSEYREEEFHQRQKEKIAYTIRLIAEYKELSENLSNIMDKHTIHDFYDEKMLIFNKHKSLIYKSIDDLPISNYQAILNELSPANQWIEIKEGKYDIIGVYLENQFNHFYAISKAYDAFGYSKLRYLRNVLVIITTSISLIVLFITSYLSNKITKPITTLAEHLNKLNLSTPPIAPLALKTSTYELQYLINKFNELVERTNAAFTFQKNAIHHISHQLKTPIAVLVSELERNRAITCLRAKNEHLEMQIIRAKTLGETIHTLLEIAKAESNGHLPQHSLRLDEILFEAIEEINNIHPHFEFEIYFEPEEFNEKKLFIKANKLLLQQAFLNILNNCISYSDIPKAQIQIDGTQKDKISIAFINQGEPIKQEEQPFIFDYFFRGQNSQKSSGLGLGLVLAQKIINLHQGSITYSSPTPRTHVFTLTFHL